MNDFKLHSFKHKIIPTEYTICLHCYTEDNSINHIHYDTKQLFKCFACNITFKTMISLADHKKKLHTSLIFYSGNYFCLHCEKHSRDLIFMIQHTINCCAYKNALNNLVLNNIKLKNFASNTTKILKYVNNFEKNKSKKYSRFST